MALASCSVRPFSFGHLVPVAKQTPSFSDGDSHLLRLPARRRLRSDRSPDQYLPSPPGLRCSRIRPRLSLDPRPRLFCHLSISSDSVRLFLRWVRPQACAFFCGLVADASLFFSILVHRLALDSATSLAGSSPSWRTGGHSSGSPRDSPSSPSPSLGSSCRRTTSNRIVTRVRSPSIRICSCSCWKAPAHRRSC